MANRKSKQLDADIFCQGLADFINGKISQNQLAKKIGLSVPTLHKRIQYYYDTGHLKAEWFINEGKPKNAEQE